MHVPLVKTSIILFFLGLLVSLNLRTRVLGSGLTSNVCIRVLVKLSNYISWPMFMLNQQTRISRRACVPRRTCLIHLVTNFIEKIHNSDFTYYFNKVRYIYLMQKHFESEQRSKGLRNMQNKARKYTNSVEFLGEIAMAHIFDMTQKISHRSEGNSYWSRCMVAGEGINHKCYTIYFANLYLYMGHGRSHVSHSDTLHVEDWRSLGWWSFSDPYYVPSFLKNVVKPNHERLLHSAYLKLQFSSLKLILINLTEKII